MAAGLSSSKVPVPSDHKSLTTPFSSARKDLSSASPRRYRHPADPLVPSLLVPVSLECSRDLSHDWNGNPALGRLRLRVVSRPQNRAFSAIIVTFPRGVGDFFEIEMPDAAGSRISAELYGAGLRYSCTDESERDLRGGAA